MFFQLEYNTTLQSKAVSKLIRHEDAAVGTGEYILLGF
jgi:hypothetical protein